MNTYSRHTLCTSMAAASWPWRVHATLAPLGSDSYHRPLTICACLAIRTYRPCTRGPGHTWAIQEGHTPLPPPPPPPSSSHSHSDPLSDRQLVRTPHQRWLLTSAGSSPALAPPSSTAPSSRLPLHGSASPDALATVIAAWRVPRQTKKAAPAVLMEGERAGRAGSKPVRRDGLRWAGWVAAAAAGVVAGPHGLGSAPFARQ